MGKILITDILKIPVIYNFLQEIVGGNKARQKFITDYVRAEPGNKIIEIGCGPAPLLRWLPIVDCIGFDTNRIYIETAQNKYGHRGIFLTGDTKLLENDQRFLNADIIICHAVLHHLNDDEVFHVMKFAYKILRAGGRLVCSDPCWVPSQKFFAKLIMSNDRGKYIRTEQDYQKLAERVFLKVKTTLNVRPIRIPTTGVVIECTK